MRQPTGATTERAGLSKRVISCATRGLQRGKNNTSPSVHTGEEKEVRQERLGVGEVGLPDQPAPRRLPQPTTGAGCKPGWARARRWGAAAGPASAPPGSLQGLARTAGKPQP